MTGLLNNDRLKTDKSIKPTQHTLDNEKKEKKNTTGNILYLTEEDGKTKLNSSLNSCLFRG